MPSLQSPGIVIMEQESGAGAPPSLSSAIPVFLMTAVRGPISRPVRIIGVEDFVSVYGGDDGGYGYQSVIGFFANGGGALWVSRCAHYTDPSDQSTLTADPSALTLYTEGTAATAASKTITGPWNMNTSAGVVLPATLAAGIDGNPSDTMTVAATASVLTAAGVPGGVGTTGHTLTFSVMGVQIVYTVPASPPTTAAEWALSIAAQLPGVAGSVTAGKVVLTTDEKGSAAAVNYVSGTGTAGADSGFGAGPTAGVNAGPNDVARLSDVQAAELAPLIQAAWTGGGGVTATADGDDVVIETVTTGSGASIGVFSGTLVTAGVIAAGALVEGSDIGSPTTATMTVSATSEGEHGNRLAVSTVRKDRAAALITEDITGAVDKITVSSTSLLRVGLQIFIEDTVNTATMRAVVRAIIGNTVFLTSTVTPVGGNIEAANSPSVTRETFDLTVLVDGTAVRAYQDLSPSAVDTKFYVGKVLGSDPTTMDPRARVYLSNDVGLSASATVDPRPINYTVEPLTGGTDSDPLVDNDWVGSSSGLTGLYALDNLSEPDLLAVPGISTVAVHRAMLDYATSREDMLALAEVPDDLSPSAAVTYVTTTANLYGTYMAIYAGRIKIIRVSTGNTEFFPAVGYIAGAYARTPVGEAPAGERFGAIRGCVGCENTYAKVANRDLVYPVGINPIWSKTGAGVVIWGQNTTQPLSDFGAVGPRRALIYLRKVIDRATTFVLFAVNDPALRAKFRRVVAALLRNERDRRVIFGTSDQESFRIVCDETNNGVDIVNARKFVAEIAVKVIPGVDFAVITISKSGT